MAKGLNLKAVLSLEAKQFKAGLNNIKRQLNSFQNFLKGAFAIGSITAFGKKMIQVGSDFENAMAKVQAVSNATTADFEAMRKEAERLGSTTKYTATEAANALENLTRNGLSASQATKALAGTLQLAQANSIELANAADILTNTMNAFGLGVQDTGRINDVLSSTAANAATNINELYEAMVVAGPYSKIMGKSIEETAAALGTLANNGIKGSNAGKALAALYQRLSDITPKAAKAFNKYGLSIDEATVKSQSLYETLDTLKKSGIGSSVESLSQAFGKNFAGSISQLINGLEDLDHMLDVTRNSAGTTERMFNQGVGSVKKEIDTLKSTYEGFLITLSQKTDGAVKGVLRLFQNLINNFKTTTGTISNLASIVVPLLAANFTKAARTIMIAFGQIQAGAIATKIAVGNIIGVVMTLVTWVGTALVGAWNRNNQAMKEANKQIDDARINAERTQRSLDTLTEKLGPETDSATLSGIVKRLCELFPDFADAIRAAAKQAAKTGDWDKLKKTLQDIKDLQDAVTTRNAKRAITDAQATELGEKLYNRGQHPGWHQYWDSPYNNPDIDIDTHNIYDLDVVAEKITKALKSNGFNKDAIKQIYIEVAKIISKENGTSVDELQKFFKDYNVILTDDDITGFIDGSTQLGGKFYSKTNYRNPDRPEGSGIVDRNRRTNKELRQADSTVVARTLQVAKQAAEDIVNSLQDKLDKKEISKDEFNQRANEAVENYLETIIDNDSENQDLIKEATDWLKKYPKPTPKPTRGSGSSGGGSGKTPKEKGLENAIVDAFNNYEEEATKLHNQLKAGTITQEEFEEKLQQVQDRAWKAITALSGLETVLDDLKKIANDPNASDKLKTEAANAVKVLTEGLPKLKSAYESNQSSGINKSFNDLITKLKSLPVLGKRDSRFDYSKSVSEIENEKVELHVKLVGDFDALISQVNQALSEIDLSKLNDAQLQQIRDALIEIGNAAQKAKEETEEMQHALKLTEIQSEIKELQKEFDSLTYQNITNVAEGLDRLYRSLQGLAEAFDEKIDIEWLEQGFAVLNFIIQTVQTIEGVVKGFQAASELFGKIQAKQAAEVIASQQLEMASTKVLSRAYKELAVSEAAASQASIPVAGPELAVAAATSVRAALESLTAFAKGGIVGGNSTTGDHNLIRANSGEMILTKGQQATLFNAIRAGHLGSGDVEFKIKGADLVGTINNYQHRRRG